MDTKPYIHTITQPSDTNNMEAVLQQLDAELEVTTEDGYTATFGSVEAPADFKIPDGSEESSSDTAKVPFNVAGLKQPLLIVSLVAVVAVGGMFVFKKIRERR